MRETEREGGRERETERERGGGRTNLTVPLSEVYVLSFQLVNKNFLVNLRGIKVPPCTMCKSTLQIVINSN